jgi:hypothetical protein
MKNLTPVVTIGFLICGNLIFIDTADAFSVTFSGGVENLGFENQYNGWTTFGDTTVQSTFQGISPQGGTSQALITNTCPNSIGVQCQDENGAIRNDDTHVNNTAGTFNYSGNDQINASVEITDNLQSLLGISDNALNIPVVLNGSEIPGVYRTPKEGSAILSDSFTTDGQFRISFDWNYLTNDGASVLGNQDFSFLVISGTTASGTVEQIITLGDSSGTIPNTTSSNFAETTGYSTYTSDVLGAGTYKIGFGIVDVDGVDRSSGLLVDEIYLAQQVPFEFSPTLGLLIVGGMVGCDRIRRQYQAKLKCNDQG